MKKIFSTLLIFTLLCLSGCSSTSVESFSDESTDTSSEKSSIVANIYSSDSEALELINKQVTLSELTPEALVNELINTNVIVENTKLKEFDKFVDKHGEDVGVLNLSKEFYNFNLGSSYESMMLDAIAKTFMDNFELDKFKILVDGNEYESGHFLFEPDEYFTDESFN